MRSKAATWYEVGIRYRKTQDDGSEKAITERYAVDALSFTEAESAITEEMSAYISGEFEIKTETLANYGEVFFSDNDNEGKWYKAKIAYIFVNEKTGKEKHNNMNYLVQAESMQGALRNIGEVMHSSLSDYEIVGLAETKVVDVIEHKVKQTDKEGK